MYRLRDERGVFSDIWASGLMRRAALARRAAGWPRTGGIHDAEHFVDAGFDEMCALLSGAAGPSADELAARHAVPHLAHREGRAAGPRRPAAPAARPVRAAAGARRA